MEHKTKAKSIVGSVVIGLILLCIATTLCVLVFVSTMSTVSGSASLPNGKTATINGPFSCSENGSTTEIEAGGHVFSFTSTAISIDGVAVGPLDATVTDVRIDAGHWSASLHINGTEVASLK